MDPGSVFDERMKWHYNGRRKNLLFIIKKEKNLLFLVSKLIDYELPRKERKTSQK